MILYDHERMTFHLQGEHVSYILSVGSDELIHHLYWGARLSCVPSFLYDRSPYRRAKLIENQPADSPRCSREYFHYECPTYGMSDFRQPALTVRECATGYSLADLRYLSHAITRGHAPIPGLPYAKDDSEVETLAVVLRDPVSKLTVTLYYHLYASLDIITRHATITNYCDGAVTLTDVMSATIDFEDGRFSLLTLDGTTLREFTPCVRELSQGTTEVSSARGISSHQHNPNAVLLRPGTTQSDGEAYGLSMIYSGNFALRFELDQYGACRAQGGINPFGFTWRLNQGEQFHTPEIVLSWSDKGLNGLSARLHPFVMTYILRGKQGSSIRPLLLNTWEACYFDVNSERRMKVAAEAKARGIELRVLDDGWFGCRNAANSSLGDWVVNREKFPEGLEALAQKLPVKLGLWFEPEMISPDSDLYRAHPDWCIHIPNRTRTLWRNQLVLDMGRDDVIAYLIDAMDAILKGGAIDYIKWDHNRRLTELGSDSLPAERQGELSHRYILGVYRLLEHIRQTYPDILLENCASGGGRFDYGMLCYFHQGWLSDNTDAVCRLTMQNAASIFFPPVTITSHVSASPNEQIGRATPLDFRANVCALFNAGYELDPTALSAEDLDGMADVSERFKAIRHTVQKGRFVRLNDALIPQEWFGWMAVDEKRAVVGYYRPFCSPEPAYWTIPLHGLNDNDLYRDTRTGETLSGSDWEAVGLRPDWRNGDFYSQLIILENADA